MEGERSTETIHDSKGAIQVASGTGFEIRCAGDLEVAAYDGTGDGRGEIGVDDEGIKASLLKESNEQKSNEKEKRRERRKRKETTKKKDTKGGELG